MSNTIGQALEFQLFCEQGNLESYYRNHIDFFIGNSEMYIIKLVVGFCMMATINFIKKSVLFFTAMNMHLKKYALKIAF